MSIAIPSTLEEAHAVVKQLALDFRENESTYRAPEYSEAAVRKDFIDKLLRALGWDVNHEIQKNPFEQEVKVERPVNISGAVKRCDYALFVRPDFRRERLFVEAKKPYRGLENADDFFQTIRYAWGRQSPVAVLTDFAELHIVDCRSAPRIETARTQSIECFAYDDYLDAEKFARLYWIISREAITNNSIEKYLDGLPTRKKKASAGVVRQRSDEAFLDSLDEYRLKLAKAFKASNQELTGPELTEATQRVLDRLVFLRFLEDKTIEPNSQVRELSEKKGQSWSAFVRLCSRLDLQYNSLVFKEHFVDRDSFCEPDDGVFRSVCQDLSDPYSPYNFDAISISVLGSIYERFLGQVVVSTAKQARVEAKPEVRKAGGVFYTPEYVVNYVVSRTVRPAIEGHNPEYISNLRIADLSCGSGSFLLGAYEELLDYHAKYFRKFPKEAAADDLTIQHDGTSRLSLKKRREILLNNIFGTDLDPQAVEVTQISLLLKLLEEESIATTRQARLAFRDAILPSLAKNIVCGNGIIATDIQKKYTLTEEEERALRPTDLDLIFGEGGGRPCFDIVLGNPPWGAEIDPSVAAYLAEKFERVLVRMPDTYLYFIDRSLRALKKNGRFGMILPATLLTQTDARNARATLLSDTHLEVVLNLGQRVFGQKVLNTSAIIVAERSKPEGKTMVVGDVRELEPERREAAIRALPPTSAKEWLGLVRQDPETTFFTQSLGLASLLHRLRESHRPLEAILSGPIQRGVTPDLLAMHVVTSAEVSSKRLEKKVLRPLLLGAQVGRYRKLESADYLIYLTRDSRIDDYPNVRDHMRGFKSKLTCREIRENKHPWFALHRPRESSSIERPKFVGLTTTKSIELAYDGSGKFFPTDALYFFSLADGEALAPEVVLAIMHSSLFEVLYHVSVQGEQRVIPQIKASKLQTIPFPTEIHSDDASALVSEVQDLVRYMEKRDSSTTETDRNYFDSRVAGIKASIDAIVVRLYGLTSEELEMFAAFEDERGKRRSPRPSVRSSRKG